MQYNANLRLPKKMLGLLVTLLLLLCNSMAAQTNPIDKTKFFTDEQLIEITLVSDFNLLIKGKLKKDFKHKNQPATITCIFPDSNKVTGIIEINARGKYRREECMMPPLLLNFKTNGAGVLNGLGKMKLVWPCGTGLYDEQMVLKEYLVYKIYNLLTEKSFQVRLVRIGYRDIKEKIKPHTFYAFFMEDIGDMARRNNCREIKLQKFNTEATDRAQTTLMTLFEYMIGNSDWAIPISRNIKLIRLKTDSLSRPFAIPYDFDYSGLVGALYAIPPVDLPITSVQERFYLGFPRTIEELQKALRIFHSQKNAMDSLILNLAPLGITHKKQMLKYLDEFFSTIKTEKDIQALFIDKARNQWGF